MPRSAPFIAAILVSLAVLMCLAGSALALVPDGTQGWYWQMPQPAGGDGLGDVTFATAKDVWAVGSGGLVLHSGDAGATWTTQATGSGADLRSVSFADGQNGAVCGDAVLTTTDGGAIWADKTPAAALAKGLDNVSFVDATHLWVATTDGAVLRSADGGGTWQRSALPGYKGPVTCAFVDATHGWAAGDGGRLWKTVDGGSRWTPQVSGLPSSDSVTQVAFYDRRHGWMLAYDTNKGGSVALTTDDGGARWRRCANVDSSATGIEASGPRSAWLVANGYYFMGISDGTGTVLQHTTDGGRHWRTSSIDAPASPWAIASHGNAVCAVGMGIIISADGGSTWRAASSGQDYTFTGASVVSPTDLWAVESNGALLHSTDGTRWAEQDTPVRWASSFAGVCFPDASNGWVVGSVDQTGDGGVIFHTTDGGVTWTPQMSNLGGELSGVDFVDDTNGWAISNDPFPFGAGAATCLERTTDGGVTWVPLYVANNAALGAVQFRDASTGWVAGSYEPVENDDVAAIFATSNGGLTWTRQSLPEGAPPLTGLQFLDANTGWAVGTAVDADTGVETGWVLTTGDGGKTWTRAPSAAGILATTIRFSDAQHGWIGGDNGVFATADGGATWQKVAGGSGVRAIAASDPQHVWAFGYGFLVSTLDASGDTAAPATVDQHAAPNPSHTPVTVRLLANDVGGSGVASTEYSTDGGTTWRAGANITVDAPADHSNDGSHTILYRSTDNAGNREATELRVVTIDTLGPACSAPRKSTVNAHQEGLLYFMASDGTSGVARATITVRDGKGHVAKRFVERAGNWSMEPSPSYFWLRFYCNLRPGTYRVAVRAVDWAGNPQVTVGHNWLRVVAKGAQRQHRPDWPPGLPVDSYGFSTLRGLAGLGAGAGTPQVRAARLALAQRARESR